MTVRESYSCFRAGSSASLASLSSFPPTSWFLSFHPEVMNPLSLSLSLSSDAIYCVTSLLCFPQWTVRQSDVSNYGEGPRRIGASPSGRWCNRYTYTASKSKFIFFSWCWTPWGDSCKSDAYENGTSFSSTKFNLPLDFVSTHILFKMHVFHAIRRFTVRPSRQLASFIHARKSGIIVIVEASWMASSSFPCCPKCQMAGAWEWESHQHRSRK